MFAKKVGKKDEVILRAFLYFLAVLFSDKYLKWDLNS